MSKTYKITLTEKQMQVAEHFIELSMRLLQGQDWVFSDDIAALNFDLNPENPNHREIFDKYIIRRDHIREVMKSVFNIAFEPYGYLQQKSDDILEAETIWDAIRYARRCSNWPTPFQSGHEPSPEIEEVEENG